MAIALGLVSAAARASSEIAQEATRLDQVDVSATRLPSQLSKRASSATRLDLTIRDVPASIAVLGQAELRARGETTALEALENSPGVVPSYSFGVLNLSGRGFSGVFNSPTLFDGIRYPGWQVSPRLLLNYEQVEVLRGPAALIAGQGSIGGSINLRPRRANGARDAAAYLGFGRFGTTTAAFGAGGSLGEDRLLMRLDASYQGSNQRGSFGYARDTSFEFFHVNSDFVIPLTETLRFGLSTEHFRDDAEGYFGSPLINGRLDEALRERNYNVVDGAVTMDVSWLRARLEWEPSATLSGRIQAYRNQEDRFYRNAEAYTYQPATQRVRRSDYLRVSHDQSMVGALAEVNWRHALGELAHQLIVGVQADQNDHDRFNDSPFRFTDSVDLVPLANGVYTSLDVFGLRTQTDIQQRSIYFESRLDLRPDLKLISGFRRDQSDVESFNALTQIRFDKAYRSNSYRTGLVYNLTSSSALYLSYATSSEPPAQITTLGAANAAFDLTRGKQLEVGFKQALPRGDWSVAFYDIARTNILSRDPSDPNRLIQIGEQGARGVELSARVELGSQVSLEGNAALLNAEFARFDERVGTVLVSRAGNLPVDVPERSATLWLNWQALTPLRLSLGARGVGRRAANNAKSVFLPGYGTLDFNLQWVSSHGTFGARVRNLGDRFYATRSYNAGNQFMTGEPRWFDVTWQRAF